MKTAKLGDVCRVIGGGTPLKGNPDYWGGDILWASVRDMKNPVIEKTEFSITENGLNNSSTNLIPKNNVIIASRVGLGKVCWLKSDTAINQDLRAIIPKDENKIDKQFLFWWLRSAAWQIEKAGVGATVKGVTLPFIKGLEMPILSLEEQRQVVARLDVAFERISAAEVLMRRNLDNVAALQKSMLHKYLNASDNTHRLGDVIHIRSGDFLPRKKMIMDGGYTVVGGNGVSGRHDQYNRTGESIVIGRVGEKCGNVHYYDEPIWVTDNAFFVSEYLMSLDKQYLAYVLRNVNLRQFAKQSAQPVISFTGIKKAILYVPSINVQKSIVEKLNSTLEKSHELELQYTNKLAKLISLRQSLLQEAFLVSK